MYRRHIAATAATTRTSASIAADAGSAYSDADNRLSARFLFFIISFDSVTDLNC